MNPLLLCLIITCCIVFVWDYVNFPQQITNRLAELLSNGKIHFVELRKPFSCSLCMTFWVTLIVLLFTNLTCVWMAFLFAWSTQYILLTYNLIDNILTTLFAIIEIPFTNLKNTTL